ncbi:unnamed protein product [Closterium sp. NIES-65]|nr:unnamed protein product [Closterium sp. NIES-65]
MGGGASEQVRWSEGGKDTSELGGNVKRDSKYTDSKFEFARRSDSGYQRSSSRTNGNNSEHDKSRRNESAESALHDYNEYNHNEYKNIPGWEWEEGEQEEEAAEAEFEAVARLWEEMEASGKVHPLSAPVGGLRWKQEAQERFPDLARTAGVFPYMGDVIEREELDTPYSCRLARTAGVFPYMGDVIEREELDTPYDYAPPPEIDSEASAMIDKLQDLLTALRLFLPHALSPTLAAPPLNLEAFKKEGEGGVGQGGWEKQGKGQEEEEEENEKIHKDKQQRRHQRQWQGQEQQGQQQVGGGGDGQGDWEKQGKGQEEEEEKNRRGCAHSFIHCVSSLVQSASLASPYLYSLSSMVFRGLTLSLLPFIHGVQRPHLISTPFHPWCSEASPYLFSLSSMVFRASPYLYSLSSMVFRGLTLSLLPFIHDRRWITALWTILLAKSGRQAVAGMGLSDWWKRNLPEHEAEIRRNLPEEEGQDERGGTGRTAAPAGQPGSAASAPAGSPLASAASADRASGPGSDQAGSERRGWNLLFGGGGEERGGQGAGGRGGGAAADAESKGESGGGWLSRFQTFLGLGKGGAGKAGEPKRLTHAEGLTEFANQLKRARQFGQLTTFGKSLPKGGQSVVTNSLRKQEVITLALASYAAEAKLADERLSIPFSVRQRVASETGSTMGEIDMLLAKYEWFAEAANRMQALQDQGKPLPRSFAEIEQMMGGPWSPPKTGARSGASAGLAGGAGSAAAAPARNNPCPCGSGKKYKRCCGAGTK